MPQQIVNRKEIYRWIVEHTPEGSRVLDIGCGDGELLSLLVQNKNIRGSGIEISETYFMQAVRRGLSVHHGDAQEGLEHYGDGTEDLVILALTLQEIDNLKQVINESFRVGKKVMVVFPNFGYWRHRWQLGWSGRAPRTRNLPYTWYESPNRHFFSMLDWEDFCRAEGWQCLEKCGLIGGKRVKFMMNLRAEVGMYIMCVSH